MSRGRSVQEQQRRLRWLKSYEVPKLYRLSFSSGSKELFLKQVANMMKKEGLYSKSTYIGDIVTGLKKILGNGFEGPNGEA